LFGYDLSATAGDFRHFKRFAHRNLIFGRAMNSQEKRFLSEDDFAGWRRRPPKKRRRNNDAARLTASICLALL